MKKRSNLIIYILLVLMLICLGAGVYGYLNQGASNTTKKKETEKKEYKATNLYYIDGISTEEMPIQEEIEIEGTTDKVKLYTLDLTKTTCSNNVEYSWDEEKWEFTPVLTTDTKCRLYFNKLVHSITLTSINGKLPNEVASLTKKIINGKTISIKVEPTAGYNFEGDEEEPLSCAKNNSQNTSALTVKAKYDKENNELTINSINQDVTCSLSFGVSTYTVTVTNVVNGNLSGEKIKKANYGETVEFDVAPNENYGNPNVVCSNAQNATLEDNKLIITGLSKDTECSVSFSMMIVRHTVTLNIDHASLIASSSSPKQVLDGENAVFGVAAVDPSYTFTGSDITCTPSDTNITIEGSIITIKNITSDVTCNIKLASTS